MDTFFSKVLLYWSSKKFDLAVKWKNFPHMDPEYNVCAFAAEYKTFFSKIATMFYVLLYSCHCTESLHRKLFWSSQLRSEECQYISNTYRSVDGMGCGIQRPSPFISKRYRSKFKGPSLIYEAAISNCDGQILHVNGPYPSGKSWTQRYSQAEWWLLPCPAKRWLQITDTAQIYAWNLKKYCFYSAIYSHGCGRDMTPAMHCLNISIFYKTFSGITFFPIACFSCCC